MKPNIDCLFSEPDYGSLQIPYDDTLDISVRGSHVYGEIYVPGEIYNPPHPCVILIHGFPGICSSDDLAQALRRAGFVVLRPNHRGAANSEGQYSFTNCIEDAVAVAEFAHTTGVERYNIDPDKIILAGHSMGGNTVLNATREIPFLKGTIMMAPYDLSVAFGRNDLTAFIDMVKSSDGKLLKLRTIEEQNRVVQNARDIYRKTAFLNSVDVMQDRNLLMIGGTEDTIAPVQDMVEPLFSALEKHPGNANHKKIYYDTGHGFSNVRLKLTEDIGSWLMEII